MKTKNLIAIILAIAMICIPAYAVQQGNLDIRPKSDFAKNLRTISGGLCGDLPDDKGTPSSLDPTNGGIVWCTGANGVTTDMTACVVQFFDSAGNKIREDVIYPGKTTLASPISTAYWQRFNCYEVEYSCSNYISKGCGESGSYARCADKEMLRVRTCSSNTPTSVETERCIDTIECRDSAKLCEYQTSSWSSCINGKQSRTITESDCSKWTDSQACVVTKTTTGSGGTKPITTTPGKEAPQIKEISRTAYYDPSRDAVIGIVEMQNTGGNMDEPYLLEMQVVKKGKQTYAFISEQQVCDEKHQENVHKNFMLGAGETTVVELVVPRKTIGTGYFDIYFLSRHKCYVDLTSEQLSLGDNYQLVGPYKGYESAGTVGVGDAETLEALNSVSNYGVIAAVVIALIGFVVMFYVMPWGIGIFATGVILFILMKILF